MACKTCDAECVDKCAKDFQENQDRVSSILKFINTLSLEQLKLFKTINPHFYMYRDIIYSKTVKLIDDFEKKIS